MNLKDIATTERTRIRKIVIEDAAFILELVNTPQWIKYIGDRGVLNLADAVQYIEDRYLTAYQEHQYGYYLISLLSGKPIGVAGFLKRPELQNPDYGFAFMPGHQNQRYGFEVSTALLDYACAALSLNNLDAITLEANKPSRKLLEKLNFQKQGLISFGKPPEELLLYRWQKSAEN